MNLKLNRDETLLVVTILVKGHELMPRHGKSNAYTTELGKGDETPQQKRARIASKMLNLAHDLTATAPQGDDAPERAWTLDEIEAVNAAITACITELADAYINAPKNRDGQAMRDAIDGRLEPLRDLRACFRPRVYETKRDRSTKRMEKPGEASYKDRIAQLIAEQLYGQRLAGLDDMMSLAWEAVDRTTFNVEGAHAAHMTPEEAAAAIMKRDILSAVLKETRRAYRQPQTAAEQDPG